ncbi:hypothetical protein CEUSTIGMA_g1908.t1 [Chlamydomonas eustigma]|uniref:Uncharacterized protein n=1 Tax=Chlamydomonas eustigma TaxID=1157962 RepID=A0A250WUR9_9CHLO|nr:hypothetical protein CEUSTIGMA_g1908.t1 [Chlamydomonas eustigma]|eukprot:GAX74459.1 hypothetical protein CEUSTIGMA_g1908.t1 [Chlamydomonas eustigma]
MIRSALHERGGTMMIPERQDEDEIMKAADATDKDDVPERQDEDEIMKAADATDKDDVPASYDMPPEHNLLLCNVPRSQQVRKTLHEAVGTGVPSHRQRPHTMVAKRRRKPAAASATAIMAAAVEATSATAIMAAAVEMEVMEDEVQRFYSSSSSSKRDGSGGVRQYDNGSNESSSRSRSSWETTRDFILRPLLLDPHYQHRQLFSMAEPPSQYNDMDCRYHCYTPAAEQQAEEAEEAAHQGYGGLKPSLTKRCLGKRGKEVPAATLNYLNNEETTDGPRSKRQRVATVIMSSKSITSSHVQSLFRPYTAARTAGTTKPLSVASGAPQLMLRMHALLRRIQSGSVPWLNPVPADAGGPRKLPPKAPWQHLVPGARGFPQLPLQAAAWQQYPAPTTPAGGGCRPQLPLQAAWQYPAPGGGGRPQQLPLQAARQYPAPGGGGRPQLPLQAAWQSYPAPGSRRGVQPQFYSGTKLSALATTGHNAGLHPSAAGEGYCFPGAYPSALATGHNAGINLSAGPAGYYPRAQPEIMAAGHNNQGVHHPEVAPVGHHSNPTAHPLLSVAGSCYRWPKPSQEGGHLQKLHPTSEASVGTCPGIHNNLSSGRGRSQKFRKNFPSGANLNRQMRLVSKPSSEVVDCSPAGLHNNKLAACSRGQSLGLTQPSSASAVAMADEDNSEMTHSSALLESVPTSSSRHCPQAPGGGGMIRPIIITTGGGSSLHSLSRASSGASSVSLHTTTDHTTDHHSVCDEAAVEAVLQSWVAAGGGSKPNALPAASNEATAATAPTASNEAAAATAPTASSYGAAATAPTASSYGAAATAHPATSWSVVGAGTGAGDAPSTHPAECTALFHSISRSSSSSSNVQLPSLELSASGHEHMEAGSHDTEASNCKAPPQSAVFCSAPVPQSSAVLCGTLVDDLSAALLVDGWVDKEGVEEHLVQYQLRREVYQQFLDDEGGCDVHPLLTDNDMGGYGGCGADEGGCDVHPLLTNDMGGHGGGGVDEGLIGEQLSEEEAMQVQLVEQEAATLFSIMGCESFL